jgi:hypothetical protein
MQIKNPHFHKILKCKDIKQLRGQLSSETKIIKNREAEGSSKEQLKN